MSNIPLILALDPISLLGIGLGVAGGFGASKLAGGSKGPAPAAPAAAPPPSAPPIQNPTGSANSGKMNKTPSFIGAAAAPDQKSFGQKTLIGQ